VHVIIVSNYKPDGQESMLRYAKCIHDGLMCRGIDVTVLAPIPILGRFLNTTKGIGKWLGYIDKFLFFPLFLSRVVKRHKSLGKDSVVHICDHSNSLYIKYLQGLPNVVTCHDVLGIRAAMGHFAERPVGWSGRLFHKWVVSGLLRARHIICVSNETRVQLLKLAGFESIDTSLVYNGLNYPYLPLTDIESRAVFNGRSAISSYVDTSYVFFVGGSQWYKNRPGVLRIFMRYAEENFKGASLLFAGKPYTIEELAILRTASEVVRSRIHHIGTPDNRGLNALYSRAECLLFPSLEEGFGWPIIEAMSAGCRVLTTNRAPMNEIGGDAAYYCNPENETECAEVLTKVIAADPDGKNKRVSQGTEWVKRFSTEGMIAGMVEGYKAVLSESKSLN
jgi:glycosyltransferase involved in cell wall biosynthesis